MSERDTQLAQFTDVTGANEERARFYLESSNWQLDVALASFYEHLGENENDLALDDDGPPAVSPEPGVQAESEPDSRPSAAVKGKSKSKNKTKPYSSSRVRTIASLHQDSESEDSGNEEGQAFYAGGSDSSGQQILGPGKNKQDIVRQMFKAVQEQGAEVVEPGQAPRQRPSTSFQGRGYRLGQSPDVTEEIGGPSARVSSQVEVTLRLWRDGFTVNDGPLRKYSDPENKEFLESVRKGEIPRELVREARGNEVHMSMENRSDEDPPTKQRVKAFTGKGNVLGSPAPSTEATPAEAAPLDSKAKEQLEEEAKKAVTIDSAQPTTTIQVRLADGSAIVVHLNHTHTVADLRRYITIARPQYGTSSFSLHTTFPRKELSDDSETVQAAGLLNAAVLQRVG